MDCKSELLKSLFSPVTWPGLDSFYIVSIGGGYNPGCLCFFRGGSFDFRNMNLPIRNC